MATMDELQCAGSIRRRIMRRIEGEKRNARWARLTCEQQWAELDRRLGVNKGATRQRTKLAKALGISYRPDKKAS